MDIGILHSIIGEQWKPIKGFPNYLVSNYGRVYSLGRRVHNHNGTWFRHGEFKIPQRKGKYFAVKIYADGVDKYVFIHRLVAEAFIPNGYDLPYVNHKDENHYNNMTSNLEWCDTTYNNTYGRRLEKVKKTRIASGNTSIVDKYSLDGLFIERFPTYYDAARSVGRPRGAGNICKCCKGERSYAYGFVWRYAKEDCLC